MPNCIILSSKKGGREQDCKKREVLRRRRMQRCGVFRGLPKGKAAAERHRPPDRGGDMRRPPHAIRRLASWPRLRWEGDGGGLRLRRHMHKRVVSQEARHQPQQDEAPFCIQDTSRRTVGACIQAEPSEGPQRSQAARVLGLCRLPGGQRQRLPLPLLPRAHSGALPPRRRRRHDGAPRGGAFRGAHIGQLRAHNRLGDGRASHTHSHGHAHEHRFRRLLHRAESKGCRRKARAR